MPNKMDRHLHQRQVDDEKEEKLSLPGFDGHVIRINLPLMCRVSCHSVSDAFIPICFPLKAKAFNTKNNAFTCRPYSHVAFDPLLFWIIFLYPILVVVSECLCFNSSCSQESKESKRE